MRELYLDDFKPGEIYQLGSQTFTEEEIIAFAERYDPQPFHVNREAAAQSIYGGVIASGFQTVCVFMRLFADGLLNRTASMGSPGLDELRWLKPVRPGDKLQGSVEILDITPSRSKPDRGVAKLRCVMKDISGDEVLTFIAKVLFKKRETG